MKIIPWKDHIYINLEKPTAGILDTSSKDSAIEIATVLEVGPGVDGIKKGNQLFVKSWAIDVVSYDNKTYYFIDVNTGGVKAIVK